MTGAGDRRRIGITPQQESAFGCRLRKWSRSGGQLGEGELAGIVRAAFGKRELVSVERLRGGSEKGVYRLAPGDRTTCVAYVWDADENYWLAVASQDQSDPFGHASGLDLFEAAHAALSSLAVRIPRAVMVDRGRSLLAGEVAVLEDVRGGTLEALFERGPAASRTCVDPPR